MLASIIIITKNQKEYLQQSLPALLQQELKEPYEIIVVDSGSTDGAIEYVISLKKIKLVKIDGSPFNYARAFNTGATHTTGTFLVRLSGDCIPLEKNCLEQLLQPFKDPRVGATYGKYTISGRKGYGYPAFWPASRFPSQIVKYSFGRKWFLGLFETGKTRDNVYALAGGFCGVRKKIWEKKHFNERLLEGEDAEYAWFLHVSGYDIIYTPHAQALHEHKIIHHAKVMTRSNWVILFTLEIVSYWLLRLWGFDRYKN